ncbi:MAG: COX15/CtaA family protein [Deltaproteobacteria bacterium]
MTKTRSDTVHRWAIATSVATFLLIIAGALVTSRDAGLAVPDWPLAYGELNPPRWYLIENIRTEHGHRIIAAWVATMTAVLALLVVRHEERRPVRWLATAAVVLVLAQALLGGLRVLALSLDLAMIHGWLAQMFFCVIVALATVTARGWQTRTVSLPPSTAWLSVAVAATVVVQLVLGIIIRHFGADIRPLLASPLFYFHIASGLALLGMTVKLKQRIRWQETEGGDWPLAKAASLMPPLLLVQIALGFASFAVTEIMHYDRQATMLESWLPTLHVATGATVLACSVVVLLFAWPGQAEAGLLRRHVSESGLQ